MEMQATAALTFGRVVASVATSESSWRLFELLADGDAISEMSAKVISGEWDAGGAYSLCVLGVATFDEGERAYKLGPVGYHLRDVLRHLGRVGLGFRDQCGKTAAAPPQHG